MALTRTFRRTRPARSNSLKRLERGGTMGGSADFSRNNLDCLRLILASIVVLFHVCALTNLSAYSAFIPYLSAHFAVRSFFVISGLLIYRSYARSSSQFAHTWKSASGAFTRPTSPVVVLAAIALYPLSTLPLITVFRVGFWKYLGANLVFLNFLAPSLPGVFTSNSISAVNGALWTLKIEVAFYLFVPSHSLSVRRFGTRKVMVGIFSFPAMEVRIRMAGVHHGRAVHFSLDGSRSIYRQLEVQFPAQLVYFCAGILLLLYFDKLKIAFSEHRLHHGMYVSSRSFLHGGHPRCVLDIGVGLRFRFLALFRELREVRAIFPMASISCISRLCRA